MPTWISMATMYENLCGNYVGGVELTFERGRERERERERGRQR
jgi:hypothetical protein